jgi:hypothetical protein
MSPEWGINANRATLTGLRALPVPLDRLDAKGLEEWEKLHNALVAASRVKERGVLENGDHNSADMVACLRDLNGRVFDLLGMRSAERRIVTDFVNERMELLHGKVTRNAVKKATEDELRGYLETLKQELDAFIAPSDKAHRVTAFRSETMGVVHIQLTASRNADRMTILSSMAAVGDALRRVHARLRQEHSQWLYFERNLKVYDGPHTYLFKPIQRAHWTATQGMLDADDVIAETLMSR